MMPSDKTVTAHSFLNYVWLTPVVLCLFAFFWNLGGVGIFDLDEGLYVAAAREMSLKSDYVVPRVNGVPFFEKPPLIYWEAAALFSTVGRSEYTARIPSALASMLTALLAYLVGVKYFSRRTALLASTLFILSPLVIGEARQLTTDATLSLWLTAALVSYIASITSASRKPLYVLCFWLSCALATLAKGAVGVLLPLLIVFVYLLLQNRAKTRATLKALKTLAFIPGILLFLFIVAPWHIAAYRSAGESFTQEYIIKQHIGRFRGGDTSHKAPFWFFVPGFLLGAFPWSLFIIPALRKPKTLERPDRDKNEMDTRSFMKVWVSVVFIFFSISGSKLVSYILPMYVPAAILCAEWLIDSIESKERKRSLVFCSLATSLLATLLWTGVMNRDRIIQLLVDRSHHPIDVSQAPPSIFTFALWLFGVAAVASIVFLALAMLNKRLLAVVSLPLGMAAVTGVVVIMGLPIVQANFNAPLQLSARFAGERALSIGASCIIHTGSPRRPSILFYLPDSLVMKGLLETDDDALIKSEFVKHSHSVILTDKKRAEPLLGDPAMRVESSIGNWRVLER